MNAPFLTVPQRLDSAPEPTAIADLFRDLDAAEAEARAIRQQLSKCLQQHMLRTRRWGMGLDAYRREIMGDQA